MVVVMWVERADLRNTYRSYIYVPFTANIMVYQNAMVYLISTCNAKIHATQG